MDIIITLRSESNFSHLLKFGFAPLHSDFNCLYIPETVFNFDMLKSRASTTKLLNELQFYHANIYVMISQTTEQIRHTSRKSVVSSHNK